MAKNKKARVPNHNHHDGPKQRNGGGSSAGAGGKVTKKKMASFSKLNTSISKAKAKAGRKQQQKQKQKQQNTTTIPFEARDRILLVGEGDFSFALSLATHHGCKSVLATSYDSEQTACGKYQLAKRNIDQLIAAGHASPKGLKRKRKDGDDGNSDLGSEDSEEWNGIEDSGEEKVLENGTDIDERGKEGGDIATSRIPMNSQGPKVLFSVDAKKLGAGIGGGGKEIRNGFPRPTAYSKSQNSNRRPLPSQETLAPSGGKKGGEGGMVKGGPWDVICFNFPHVGGLSTDVNRQVRSNQELLVSFFKTCVPLLSTPDRSANAQSDAFMSSSEDDNYSDNYGYDSEEGDGAELGGGKRKQKLPPRTEPGQILVTIFEGEPYTLWNVRDLARHTGLRVVRSFKFPWSSYPGYAHARTLGEIEAKDGSGRGGWKGEDRDARTFIFEVKDVDGDDGPSANKAGGKGKGKKKGRGDGGDSSEG